MVTSCPKKANALLPIVSDGVRYRSKRFPRVREIDTFAGEESAILRGSILEAEYDFTWIKS